MLASLATAITLAAGATSAPSPPLARVEAVVLGVAQDGGVPQANCRCERCAAARRDPRRAHRVASLALLDAASRQTFLVDATPDLPTQLDSLIADPLLPLPEGRTPVAGILLTHAHVGHYAGLLHFGREALASRDLKIHATARMAGFLDANAPWSQLVRLSQICLLEAAPGVRFALSPSLHATAIPVPHRDELSDTVAYLIEGPTRKLLWLPDIDAWDRWEYGLDEILMSVDYAFLDATFHSAQELPGRSLKDIPHPLATDTAARVQAARHRGLRTRVFLVHFNHSNPLLGPDPAAREAIEAMGVEIAFEGLRLLM